MKQPFNSGQITRRLGQTSAKVASSTGRHTRAAALALIAGLGFSLVLCQSTPKQDNWGATGGVIVAEGEGRSAVFFSDTGLAYERALEQAFRDAVGKASGNLLESETKTANLRFISEEISSKTTGLIKSHEVLEKRLTDNGTAYYVKIKAFIYPRKVRERLDNILTRLGNPKMMFLINETIYLKNWRNYKRHKISNLPGNTYSEVAIGDYLSKAGIQFVDKNVIEDLTKKNRAAVLRAAGGNAEGAIGVAGQLADVVIIGEAESNDAGSLADMGIGGGQGMYSAQASLRFKVVDVSSGNIIAQETGQAAHVHVEKVTAGQEALKKASTKTLTPLLAKIKEYYLNKPRQNEITLNLVGLGAGSKEAVALKSLMLTVTRSQKITNVKAGGNVMQWRVIYPGTAEGLMEELTLKQKQMGFQMDLVEYNLATINYKVTKNPAGQ